MAGTVTPTQVHTGKTAGVAPNYVAAAASMELPNQAPTILHVKNGSGAAITVTGTNQTFTPDGAQRNPDKVTNVPAGGEVAIRYEPGTYNMGNGSVQLTFSATAGVTVSVIQLP